MLSLFLVGAGCASSVEIDLVSEDVENEEVVDESEVVVEIEELMPVDEGADEGEVINEDELEVESEDDDSAGQEPQELPEPEEEVSDVMGVSMESGNFFFSPSTITVEPGQEVAMVFAANSGTHTFVIDEIGFKSAINEGGSVAFTAPVEPGSYAYYCDVGSHRALGMEGVLIVK